jgi:hypothetical protein
MSLQEASPLSVGVVIDASGQQHQQQHSTQAERAGRSAAMKQSSTVTMAVVSNCQAFMLLLDQHAMRQGVAILLYRAACVISTAALPLCPHCASLLQCMPAWLFILVGPDCWHHGWCSSADGWPSI